MFGKWRTAHLPMAVIPEFIQGSPGHVRYVEAPCSGTRGTNNSG
jgi:hypothetical protein